MAKIDRKRLSRGTKLMPEHVFDPLTAAKNQLTGIDIEQEQMARPYAPFAINLSIPYLSHEVKPSGVITIPFLLPPLQDTFATATVGSETSPSFRDGTSEVLLSSVSFSFDQRAEPAAIASHFWSATGGTGGDPAVNGGTYGMSDQQGELYYDGVVRYGIHLSIMEKDQYIFGDPFPNKVRSELWSMLIPPSAYAGASLRANPFIQTDIDVVFDRYKTFVLSISCPELADPDGAGKDIVLPSIEVSMRFKHLLVERDSGSNIQNVPDDGGSGDDKYGGKTAPTVTITAPASGSAIEADESDGVSYNITSIDNEFRAKLEGGYNKFGDVPPTEVIKDDAAYDVIAVPLFGNNAHGGISSAYPVLAASPYIIDGPYSGTTSDLQDYRALFDRRIIQVRHPITIHHAFLAWNWTPFISFDGNAVVGVDNARGLSVPPSKFITMKCGIGIGSGLHADNFDYDSIAELTLTDPCNFTAEDSTKQRGWGEGSSLVDRVMSTEDPPGRWLYGASSGATLAAHWHVSWNWEVHALPLTGSGQPGYFSQGYPVFVGPGWTTTKDRRDIGGAAPPTAGAEQWLEVRCAVYNTDSASHENLNRGTWFYNDIIGKELGEQPNIFVGYGGCYVYLICKKHLTR